MSTPARKTATDRENEIATVRIDLVDSDPLIWRQVEVPTSLTLEDLHDVVQAAMGWFNYHLWEFTIGKQDYGLPSVDDDWRDTPLIDASEVMLRDVLKPRKTRIGYLYDFGDSWEHRLSVSKVRTGDPGLSYPRYVAGEYAAPPEDCGGIPGFYNALEVLADADHEDHSRIKEWFDTYDPNVIDEAAIKNALSRIAKHHVS
jgi:hypothetical protein